MSMYISSKKGREIDSAVDYVQKTLPTKLADIQSDIDNVYTKEEIEEKGYLTQHQDLSSKADLEDVYTKDEINSKLSSVYKYKGTKDYYFLLPEVNDVGDVYNVKYASGTKYETTPKTYTEYSFHDATILPFTEYGLTGFYIAINGFSSRPSFLDSSELKVGVYSPSYYDDMVTFTVPVLSQGGAPSPATNCAYYSSYDDTSMNTLYIFVVETEFSSLNASVNSYEELYNYIKNHPWNPTEEQELHFNDEEIYVVEDVVVKDGDNVAWTGEEWDVLGGTTDLTAYATKEELTNLENEKAGKDLSNVEDSVFLDKINAVLADGDEVSY